MRSKLTAICGLCILPAFAHADVVFDNFRTSTEITAFEYDLDIDLETDSTVEVAGGRESISRSGDVVTLAGSARFVNLFEVRIGGSTVHTGQPTGSADMILEIYTVSGGLPDALLWSGEQTVEALPRDWQAITVPFAPNISVPDSIAWAIRFENFDGLRDTAFGLVLEKISARTVGSSPDTYLRQDSATGDWTAQPYFTYVDGVARISAVPSAATLPMLAAGLLTTGRRRDA